MYKSYLITILTLIGVLGSGNAQIELTTTQIKKYLEEENYTTLGKFAQLENERTQLIITRKHIEIEYSVNKKTGKLETTQKISDQFYSISGNNYRIARGVQTDENKELEKVGYLKKKGGFHKTYYKCADSESSSVFYSGSQVCRYTAQVPTWYMPTMSENYVKLNPATYVQQSTYLDARYMALDFFVDEIPIMEYKITVTVPYEIDVDIVSKNFDKFDIKLKKSDDTKHKEIRYEYTGYNLPTAISEPDMLGPTHLYPYIIFVPKSYQFEEKKITMFNSLDGLYSWYHQLSEQTDNKTTVLLPIVEKLTKGKANDTEKAKAIFYWVQDNIRYIAFEDGLAGFKPASCDNVFNKKYGDCKGMANLTKEMLQLTGIDGRLTWLGTNRLATDYTVPTLASDNHMICTATLDGKRYFMDPTEKYISFNDYAERIQGRPVLIENGDSYIIDTIPSFDETRNEINRIQKLKIVDSHLKGTLTQQYKGEGKVELMYLYNDILGNYKDKAVDYLINRGDNNIKIIKHNTPNFSEREKPLEVTGTIDISNKVLKFDDELYIEFDQFKDYQNGQIDTTRKSTLNFSRKTYKTDVVELVLPRGYKVKHIPEDLIIQNNTFSLEVTFKEVGQKIIYKKSIKLKQPMMEKENFQPWNDMIDKLNKSIYKNMIVLTKI